MKLHMDPGQQLLIPPCLHPSSSLSAWIGTRDIIIGLPPALRVILHGPSAQPDSLRPEAPPPSVVDL